MEKYYFIVDAKAPAEDSVVKFEDSASMITKEAADAFIAANQEDLEVAIILEDGIEITKRYTVLEVQEVVEE